MAQAGLKERFCRKIYEELQEFKQTCARERQEDIFEVSQKAEIFASLYEILLESADSFSEVLLSNLVNQSANILESLYEDFQNSPVKDDFYNGLNERMGYEYGEGIGEYGW